MVPTDHCRDDDPFTRYFDPYFLEAGDQFDAICGQEQPDYLSPSYLFNDDNTVLPEPRQLCSWLDVDSQFRLYSPENMPSVYSNSTCSTCPRPPSRLTTPKLETPCYLPQSDQWDSTNKADLLARPLFKSNRGQTRNQSGYECAECHISFPTSHERESHARGMQHLAYMCRVADCSKKLSRRDTLVRHEATHKRSKPHRCKECPKMFKRKDNLRHHVRSVHDESRSQAYTEGPCCNSDRDVADQSVFSDDESPNKSAEKECISEENSTRGLQDATKALNGILGGRDPTVQLIERNLKSNDQSTKVDWLSILARLMLSQPSDVTKQRLESLAPVSFKTELPQ